MATANKNEPLLPPETVREIIDRVDAANVEGFVRFSKNDDGSLKRVWSREEVERNAHLRDDTNITPSGRLLAYLLVAEALSDQKEVTTTLARYHSTSLIHISSNIVTPYKKLLMSKFAGHSAELTEKIWSYLNEKPSPLIFAEQAESDKRNRSALPPVVTPTAEEPIITEAEDPSIARQRAVIEQLRKLGEAVGHLRADGKVNEMGFHTLLELEDRHFTERDIGKFERGDFIDPGRLPELLEAIGTWLNYAVNKSQKLFGKPIKEEQKVHLQALSLQAKDMGQYFLLINADDVLSKEFIKAMKEAPVSDQPQADPKKTATFADRVGQADPLKPSSPKGRPR